MRNTRGTILILVLWVVAMMALLSLAVGVMVRQSLKAAQKFDTREELRLAGDSCIRKAMAVLDQKPVRSLAADSLRSQWNGCESNFKDVKIGRAVCSVMHEGIPDQAVSERKTGPVYGVVDENRKLNINTVKSPKILTRFFQRAASLAEKDAYAIAVSILDWIDEDDHPHDAGAESRYYELLDPPYRPKNAPFATLEEMMMVKGVTPGIFERVRPYLTVTGNGQLNLNTVSPIVLESLGLERNLVDKLMFFRRGRDQKIGTMDDGIFSSISTALSELLAFQSLSNSERAVFDALLQSGNVTTQSSSFIIRSVARVGARPERLEQVCVYERHGKVLSWRERYFSELESAEISTRPGGV
jgi:general secretion pathway protein K